MVGAVLALLGRRRFPFAAPATLWIVSAAVSFADGTVVVDSPGLYIAGLVAAFLLGALDDDARARAGLAVVVGSGVVLTANNPEAGDADLVVVPAIFAVAWVAGHAQRTRVRQAEAASRLAIAEERARIARELHDVAAHAMSVMVLQVGAVRHRLGDHEDTDALRDVERTGRAALTEMRRLLGAMRRDDEAAELTPQPGLGHLDLLLDQVRGAGLQVDLEVRGTPVELPDGIDLSAYRIVQEGLTNALKHARATRAAVTIGYDPAELRIAVRDDGRGPAGADGLGHGLVGVGERVKLYGGEMRAGRADGGGFELDTRLPLQEARA